MKRKKIKLPVGGEITGTLTNSSGTALPNSVNQSAGNMGAVIQDPYAFSKAMGVTTLTPAQWKKLDAGQQQAIWRQGFEVAGFKQIGENSFSANGQTNSFSLGGNIGNLAGQALSFIPGVGPTLSSIATPMLGQLGNNIEQNITEGNTPGVNPPPTANPFGFKFGGPIKIKYKDGGFVPEYEIEDKEVVMGNNVQLEGTASGHSSSVGKVGSGKIHKYGGIDGKGGNFVISDRLTEEGKTVKNGSPESMAAKARPYMKALASLEKKGLNNNINKATHELMKSKVERIANINAAILEKRAKKKFAVGGPIVPPGMKDFLNSSFALNTLQRVGTTEYPTDDNPTIVENNTPAENPIIGPRDYNTTIGYNADTTIKPFPVNPVEDKLKPIPNPMRSDGRGIGVNTSDTKNPMDLNKLGMMTSIGSAVGQGALTLSEYFINKDKNPNINFMEDVSSRGESMLEDSIRGVVTAKKQNAQSIRRAYSPMLSKQNANSINVDRAIKANAYNSMTQNVSSSNANYDKTISDIKINKGSMAFQGDSAVRQGQFRVNEANQQDIANLFTSLGFNLSDATNQGLNAVKIAQGAKSQSQAIMMLKRAYPKMTLEQINGIYQIIAKGEEG